jgi:hypothetical protein
VKEDQIPVSKMPDGTISLQHTMGKKILLEVPVWDENLYPV